MLLVQETIGSRQYKRAFEAFQWDAQEIDGHDADAIKAAIAKAKETKGKPSVIVCDCVKGKGLSFMENDNAWHKGVPTEEQYQQAVKELGGAE